MAIILISVPPHLEFSSYCDVQKYDQQTILPTTISFMHVSSMKSSMILESEQYNRMTTKEK